MTSCDVGFNEGSYPIHGRAPACCGGGAHGTFHLSPFHLFLILTLWSELVCELFLGDAAKFLT